jgi:hypothetical protein
MPNRIYAVVEAVQPPRTKPAPDRLPSQPKSHQLPPPDNPMLPLGQGGDRGVKSVSPF